MKNWSFRSVRTVPAPGSLNTFPPSQKSAMSPQYRQGLDQTKVSLEKSFPIFLSVCQTRYTDTAIVLVAIRIFNKDMALLVTVNTVATFAYHLGSRISAYLGGRWSQFFFIGIRLLIGAW